MVINELDVVNMHTPTKYKEFLETIEKIQVGNFQDLDSLDDVNLQAIHDMFFNIISIRENELIDNG